MARSNDLGTAGRKLTTAPLIALGTLLVALAVLVTGTIWLIARDRAELAARFAADRLKQVGEAAREVGGDLDDVTEDLQFAGRLVQASGATADRQRVLEALLGSVKPYRAAAVYGSDGKSQLTVMDPRRALAVAPELLRAMTETAHKAQQSPAGPVQTSFPIKSLELSWHRVFAMPLGVAPSSRPTEVLALLVDTEPFLEKLQLVAADPQSQLLILGPHGRCAPTSEPRLCRAIDNEETRAAASGKLSRVAQAMRAGNQGTLVIEKNEAVRLGFDAADLVVGYAPIHIRDASSWSMAMFTTMAAVRGLEQRMIWRMALVSAGIALALIGFGSYVLVSSRRAAVLRERLLHASELAHAHEKAQKILENIPTGVMALAEDGRITAMNQALHCRIPQAAPGQRLEEAFPEASEAALRCVENLVEKAQSTGRPASLLVERLALFGEEGQYSLHAVPLEHPFPDARILLVLEDFTRVRALESQLLRSEKLSTVGVLAAGVAHEIGTPLGVVRGRAEYILGKLGPEHKETAGLRIIIDQIDRVTGTIRELLDFSRAKPATVAPVVVAPLVKNVVELLRYETGRHNLRIEVNVSEKLPPIAADGDQLQQVLINLLMNACAACSDGQRISLAANPSPEGEHVVMEIADEGCGIPTEDLHRVFDPFFTTKKRGQGTGLGLTIVSQIVRNHAAEIELESEVGRGTRVVLRWPTAKSKG